jgi:hypothetical protein
MNIRTYIHACKQAHIYIHTYIHTYTQWRCHIRNHARNSTILICRQLPHQPNISRENGTFLAGDNRPNLAGNSSSSRVHCELEVSGLFGTLQWQTPARPLRFSCTNATIHPETAAEQRFENTAAFENAVSADEVKIWREMFRANDFKLGGKFPPESVYSQRRGRFVIEACEDSSLAEMRVYADE